MSCRHVACSMLMAIAASLPVACGGDEVADYCSYGAVSQPQLEGCIDHVDSANIDRLDTNAARYARGDLDDCLSDAGPFCEPR